MANDGIAKMQRSAALRKTFTPSTPISNMDLFFGRFDQIAQVVAAIGQPGLQVALYGERGVGKSSLANLLAGFASPAATSGQQRDAITSARINCSTQDTFGTIWRRVFAEMKVDVPESWSHSMPDPDDIRIILQRRSAPCLIVLDEFDRWEDDDGLTLMADTIKSMSDHAVASKIVIVGVADSIDGLIGEHESILRCLEQVEMPRMSYDEVLDIPWKGYQRLGIEAEERALSLIAGLSEGLPSFAHHLALHAGLSAVQDDRIRVLEGDVHRAIDTTSQKHSVLNEYRAAVRAQRAGTLYESVLLACAIAPKDKLGWFTAADVRGPMTQIMSRPYEIPAFSPHLKAFTEAERGPALRREGPERSFRYRFRNPMLQPFVVLTALAESRLPESNKDALAGGKTITGTAGQKEPFDR